MEEHKENREQARDTGLAMVLLLLLLAWIGGRPQLLPGTIALLLLCMLWPQAFRPLVRPWLGLSHLLGAVSSRLVLTLLFVLVVTPVGVMRRLAGADPLQLRQWKRNADSVLRVREGRFRPADLEHPY